MPKPTMRTAMLVAAALFAGAPAAAQEAGAPALTGPAPPEAAPACELHVWPGRSFHSVYYGWAHGGTVDGAAKGRSGYPPVPEEPLAPAVQREILAGLDLPAIVGLHGFSAVLHDQPLSAAAIRTAPGRQIAGSVPCYAELMIDDIVFQNNAINGRWLNVMLRLRQFGEGEPAPARTFGTYVLTRVTLFPPAEGADPGPALAELRAAFGRSMAEFGNQYAAYLKRNGKKKGASITL